jgi:hypothetical protein
MTYYVVVDSEGYEQFGTAKPEEAVIARKDLEEMTGEAMQIMATGDMPKGYAENLFFD